MDGILMSSRPKGWPRHAYQKRAGAIFFGLVAVFAAWMFEWQFEWDGMQRYYLAHYVVANTGLIHKFLVLHTVDRKGKWRPAIPAEIVPVNLDHPVRGVIPFRLSEAALQAGEVKLANPVIPVDPQLFVKFLRNWVYNGESLEQLLKPGVEWGFAVMIFGLVLAWPADRKARRILEDGRRVRGAEMVTRDEFNQRRKYNLGIGFKTLEKPSLREKLWIKYPYGPMIVIPEWDEPKHFLLMGDTGSGKSALMRQILWQLTKQQETAIVYDPAREYVERFYNPERGDIILNPLDARAPYWNPGDELDHEAEARTIAESVFPDQPHEPPFFTQTPRKIFAAMLRAGMDAGQMVETMCDGDALNRLVEGTEMASMISQAAPSQREGVRASLNLVADALRLLKTKEEATTSWTAREWATKRTGWIFLTSTPELRAPLQPLLSVWLDLLVLRLMNTESGPQRRVWFVFDELGSLQKLPQLSTALTDIRNNYSSLTIQTNPADTQKAINAINSSNASLTTYNVYGQNCTTVCRDVLQKILGLKTNSIRPASLWEDAFFRWSKQAQHPNCSAGRGCQTVQVQSTHGVDYGNPRYGMNTFDFVWMLLQQQTQQQPTTQVTSTICFTDENGKQACQ
jgi:hypothetical protein